MKRIKIIVSALILLLIIIACDIGNVSIDLGSSGESSQTQAQPVEAGIDSPSNGSTLPMGPIEIAYHATSTEGVSAIELSINGEVVNSFASPDSDQKVIALKYTWQPNGSGSHTIRVRAQNSAGAWSDFSDATVNIEGGQQVPQQQNPPTEPETPKEPDPPTAPEASEDMTISNVGQNLDKFYYGSDTCGSKQITISADITHPEDVTVAVLFIRFYDNDGGGLTTWDSGRPMSHKSGDQYSITLSSSGIPNYNTYKSAVMEYQIVVQGKAGNIPAKTAVNKNLKLEFCP